VGPIQPPVQLVPEPRPGDKVAGAWRSPTPYLSPRFIFVTPDPSSLKCIEISKYWLAAFICHSDTEPFLVTTYQFVPSFIPHLLPATLLSSGYTSSWYTSLITFHCFLMCSAWNWANRYCYGLNTWFLSRVVAACLKLGGIQQTTRFASPGLCLFRYFVTVTVEVWVTRESQRHNQPQGSDDIHQKISYAKDKLGSIVQTTYPLLDVLIVRFQHGL